LQWQPGRFAAFCKAPRIAIKFADLTSAFIDARPYKLLWGSPKGLVVDFRAPARHGQQNRAEFVIENWAPVAAWLRAQNWTTDTGTPPMTIQPPHR
jgi:hypothetical protein